MPQYFFSLDSDRPFDDVDGLELPDLDAVRDEATGFARDIMKTEPDRRDWSRWVVRVTDEKGEQVFTLAFSEAR